MRLHDVIFIVDITAIVETRDQLHSMIAKLDEATYMNGFRKNVNKLKVMCNRILNYKIRVQDQALEDYGYLRN